jgi:hypothetical protein
MVLAHVLLTRFSYRDAACRAGRIDIIGNVPTFDPLVPHRLEQRFKLFDVFCLPSVLAQTTKDFTWLILIDPELKPQYRDRLHALTRGHPETHLVEATSLDDLNHLDWLRPYVTRPGVTHIATTNIDDDDLVGPRLMAATQAYLREREAQGLLRPCTIVGCKTPPCWDFVPTRRAPLGYRKPWYDPDYPVMTAYTVCCKQPEYNVAAIGFTHSLRAAYFDPAVVIDDETAGTQVSIRAAAERTGDDWRQWRPAEHLHLLESDAPHVVVVNHVENQQFSRLIRGCSRRRPVTGPDDFPEMPIDFAKARAVIHSFRRSPAAHVRHLSRRLRVAISGQWTGRARWRMLFYALTAPVWFVIGMPEHKRR